MEIIAHNWKLSIIYGIICRLVKIKIELDK